MVMNMKQFYLQADKDDDDDADDDEVDPPWSQVILPASVGNLNQGEKKANEAPANKKESNFVRNLFVQLHFSGTESLTKLYWLIYIIHILLEV